MGLILPDNPVCYGVHGDNQIFSDYEGVVIGTRRIFTDICRIIHRPGENAVSTHLAAVKVCGPWNTERLICLVQKRREVIRLYIDEAHIE
jgi:hypothetical protein